MNDYNEDGTLFRRTEITIGTLGEFEVAEYNADGSPVKKNFPSQQSSSENPVTERARVQLDEDRVVGSGRSAGEYFDQDAHGNWTRGKTVSNVRVYASGNRVKTEEWTYREIAYY